jgi:hypothetical protein
MIQPKHPPILSIVGFAVTGLFSFGLLCAMVLVRPDILAGEVVRGPDLVLAHLTTLGWISSLLFAATYLVSPVLAGDPLWSRRLPAFHFLCHLVGLGLLIGASAVLNYEVAALGSGILLLGFLALLLNIYQTGSARSLWTPSNLAFHSAMFWLIVTAGTALLMLRSRVGADLPIDADLLMAVHAQYGLFGFLVQVLLAVSLRIVPEMLREAPAASSLDRLGWAGWGLLNGGLLLLIPVSQPGWTWPLFVAGLIIAVGVLCFVAQVLAMLWRYRSRISWPELTHGTGILLLAVIVVAALGTYPRAAAGATDELREWMRLYISLALLGPFAFAVFGVGQRLIPRLVWRLRLAPWAQHGQVPDVQSLARPAAGGPVYFSLLLAWGYLAFGQWTADLDAIRLGGLLMLIAAGWFIIRVKPAILRFVVGVTPDDLKPAAPVEGEARDYRKSEPVRRSSDAVSNLQPLTLG